MFKGSGRRGHADSLNLLLSAVRSRYLFYLEDDWLTLPPGDDDNNLAFGADFVSAALAVLQESPEEMAQVLINDQSSRDCAEARPGACPAGEVGQGAGWLHEFGVMYASHAFSYWPGFSLNPALWDLRRLGLDFGLRSVAAAAEAGTAAAEQSMSLRLQRAGLAFGHLVGARMRHIGMEASAYALNGFTRPWDAPSAL
ncbi:unnamed protein product [Phaeothamnion confervicola]